VQSIYNVVSKIVVEMTCEMSDWTSCSMEAVSFHMLADGLYVCLITVVLCCGYTMYHKTGLVVSSHLNFDKDEVIRSTQDVLLVLVDIVLAAAVR